MGARARLARMLAHVTTPMEGGEGAAMGDVTMRLRALRVATTGVSIVPLVVLAAAWQRHTQLLARFRSVLAPRGRGKAVSFFTVTEPLVGLLMLTGFSQVYTRVKSHMVQQLAALEDDLRLLAALSNVIVLLRTHGTHRVDRRLLDTAVGEHARNVHVRTVRVDERVQCAVVSAVHPRSGRVYTVQVVLPAVHRAPDTAQAVQT